MASRPFQGSDKACLFYVCPAFQAFYVHFENSQHLGIPSS